MDFFRLVGGFLYWNSRKTVYRWRGAGGRCPCQHPSDSGRAWETGCNAITHWDQPERFRRICPLLLKDTNGRWRCSVNKESVRPFWGRAFLFYGGGFAILYAVATLAAFTALRTVGYQVTYPGVVWPPAWRKFDEVKSDFFYSKFHRAYVAHDTREALLDLSIAYDLNPENYDAGLLLAQLYQVGQPALSDRVYLRLLAGHPARADQTAQAFFRALLARGDFKAVQELAGRRLLDSSSAPDVWLNAFLFANRRTGDTAALDVLIQKAATRPLPGNGRTILELADALRTAAPEDARQLLITMAGRGAAGYTLYHICRQLIARGFSQAALGLIDQPDSGLNVRDRIALRLDALAASGWSVTLDKEVAQLLLQQPTAPVVEVLGTHLIRWPNAGLFGKLYARLQQSPLPKNEESYAAYLVVFCAAGADGNKSALNWSRECMKEILGAGFTSLDAAGKYLLGEQAGHLENYLSMLHPPDA
ncbi:MAG: hypothetical protein WC661_14635 [Opitutaceae bacterium]|jgi:hypothetical protein